jgi:hypothetical protein
LGLSSNAKRVTAEGQTDAIQSDLFSNYKVTIRDHRDPAVTIVRPDCDGLGDGQPVSPPVR